MLTKYEIEEKDEDNIKLTTTTINIDRPTITYTPIDRIIYWEPGWIENLYRRGYTTTGQEIIEQMIPGTLNDF